AAESPSIALRLDLSHSTQPMNPTTRSHPTLILMAACLLGAAVTSQAKVSYIGEAIIAGNDTDLSGLPGTILEDGGSPQNALNGFGSGLAYAGGNIFYALADRGPNKVVYTGGAAVDNTTSYPNRFQQFAINVTPVTSSLQSSGTYSSYNVQATNVGTILLKNS